MSTTLHLPPGITAEALSRLCCPEDRHKLGPVPATITPPRKPSPLGVTTDEARLNKTERAYLAYLRVAYPGQTIGIQNHTLKLGDDCRFTPDLSYWDGMGKLVMVDVKGFQRDDALVKIKVAARLFPRFRFEIVKKTKNGWEETRIRP